MNEKILMGGTDLPLVWTAENLRAQLKDYLEESGRMKIELSELRRENDRLKAK